VTEKKTTELLSTVPRDNDLEIRVREIEFNGLRLVDVREYIPSRERFGHGITFPKALTEDVYEALGLVLER